MPQARNESIESPRNPGAFPRPTRKEIDLYYKTHRSEFYAGDRVHALHIVKNLDGTVEREEALACLKRAEEELARGTEFGAVADRYSDCAGNGGDLGWFPRGVMVEEFESVVFEAPIGENTPIFETPFGFHIARVMERRAAGIPPLREVYDLVAEQILARRKAKAPRA
jgi:parvulin-like peptidyl-prolyl isomerase